MCNCPDCQGCPKRVVRDVMYAIFVGIIVGLVCKKYKL
jgi:hypothetical protein